MGLKRRLTNEYQTHASHPVPPMHGSHCLNREFTWSVKPDLEKQTSQLSPLMQQCNKKCTLKGKSSEAVQCDVCFVWVHASCEGFTKDQYKAFSDLSKSFPNIAYCCKLNGCLTRLNQLMAINSKSKPSVEINEVLEDLKRITLK